MLRCLESYSRGKVSKKEEINRLLTEFLTLTILETILRDPTQPSSTLETDQDITRDFRPKRRSKKGL